MSYNVKIKISNAEDRDILAAMLFRNGYEIRPAKARRPDSKSALSCVEIIRIPDAEVEVVGSGQTERG
jgi:hypothetical protein